MADKNTPNEALSTSTHSARKDAEVISAAKEKLRSASAEINGTDVKSDGIEEGDAEYRAEALKFIDKECLRLPDAEFKRLVEQIVEVLKRKDVEIGSVVTESKAALDRLRADAGTGGPGGPVAESVPLRDGVDAEKPAAGAPETLSEKTSVSEFVATFTAENAEAGADRIAAYFIDCAPTHREYRLQKFLLDLQTDPEALRKFAAYSAWGGKMPEILSSKRGERGEKLWWSVKHAVDYAFPEGDWNASDSQRKLESWAADRKKYREAWNDVLATNLKVSDSKTAAELARTISGLYATDESRPHVDIFVNAIRTNPVVAISLVANFTEDSPLAKELRKTKEGKYAHDVFVAMRAYAATLHGLDPENLPENFSKDVPTRIKTANDRLEKVHVLEDKNDEIRNRALELWQKAREAFGRGEEMAKDSSNKTPWSELEDLSTEIERFFANDVAAVRKFRNDTFGKETEARRPPQWTIVDNVAATRGMFDDFVGFARAQNTLACYGNAKDYTVEQMRARIAAYDENFKNTDSENVSFVYEKRNEKTGEMETETIWSDIVSHRIREEIVNWSDGPEWPKEPEVVGKFLENMHARSGGNAEGMVNCIRDELGKHYEDFLVRIAGLHAGGAEAGGRSKLTRMQDVMTMDARWTLAQVAEGKGGVLDAKEAVKLDPKAFRETLLKAGFKENVVDSIVEALMEKARETGGNIKILDQYKIIYEKSEGKISFHQAATFLRESSLKSLGKAKAYESLAQGIIDGKQVIGNHSGFESLLNILGERTANPDSGDDEANVERNRKLLLELPKRSLSADAFYAELRKTEGLAKGLLQLAEEESKPGKEDGGYVGMTSKRIELFALWLRYKIEADEGLKDGITANRAAKTLSENPNAKDGALVGEGQVEAVLTSAEADAKIATDFAYEIQSLRSEGRAEEAESLAEKVFGSKGFDLRNGISEKEVAVANAYAENAGNASTESLRSVPSSVLAERIGANLPIGETVRLPIGGRDDEVSVTNEGGGKFVVAVDGKKAYECPEKDLGAHLDMAKFLCENGLAFLAEHSEEILKRASVADGNLKEADGGSFWPDEKRKMLSTVASIFGVEGFPHGESDVGRMESYLRTYATERKTDLRRMGRENGLLDEAGNVRNPEKLYERAKAA